MPLRQDTCTLLQQLLVMQHSQKAVRGKIVAGLSSLDAEQVTARGMAAVLALGGSLDQLLCLGASESESALGREGVRALLEACGRAMASKERRLAGRVLRSRLLKTVWELSGAAAAKALIGGDSELQGRLLASAQDRALAPLKCVPSSKGGGSSSARWRGKFADEDGAVATLDGTGSCFAKVVSKGKHYIEVQFMDMGSAYLLVGVASESFQDDDWNLGYYVGSWAWANDSDFKVRNTACWTDRGQSHEFEYSFAVAACSFWE